MHASYYADLAARAYPGDLSMRVQGMCMDAERRRRKLRTQISSKWAEIENLSLGWDTAASEAKQATLRREIRALEEQMYTA